MIVNLSVRLFKESLTRQIYYRIKAIPIIRLFFDFEYTGRLFKESFFGKTIEKIASKAWILNEIDKLKIPEKYLPYFLCACIYSMLLNETIIIPLMFISALAALPYLKQKTPVRVMILVLAFSAVFARCINFSDFSYIIYVETGIILFFIIKYSSDYLFERFIKIASILWIASGFSEKTGAYAVLFMPYALEVLKSGKIRKYFYSAVILSIGFYILSASGRSGIIGGSAGVVLMFLSGEGWLFLPILLAAPAAVSFALGVLEKNIIQTGYFFWRYGFGGAAVGYGVMADNVRELGIISYGAYAGIFIFFWYALRISRSATLKLVRQKFKNGGFLRCGLSSVIGFSLYTFFAYNQNFIINIILYLLGAALLKRTDEFKA